MQSRRVDVEVEREKKKRCENGKEKEEEKKSKSLFAVNKNFVTALRHPTEFIFSRCIVYALGLCILYWELILNYSRRSHVCIPRTQILTTTKKELIDESYFVITMISKRVEPVRRKGSREVSQGETKKEIGADWRLSR